MKYLKLTVTLVSLLSSVVGEAAWARDNNRAYSSRNDHSSNYLRNDHARNHLRGDSGHNRNHYNGHHWGHHKHYSHRHSHSRVIIAPVWPYYHHHYHHAPVVVTPAPSSPPVYIEQGNGRDAAYWYHCNNPEGYYPYIKECPGGWQKVVPHAPPS